MAPAPSGRNARTSPIVRALAEAESGTTGEIRVHLTRRWIERDPFARAQRIFREYGMHRTAQGNAVLLYVNLRLRRMAVVAGDGIHKTVGQTYWDGLLRELRSDLHSTYYENAIAVAVRTLGATLMHYFPRALD